MDSSSSINLLRVEKGTSRRFSADRIKKYLYIGTIVGAFVIVGAAVELFVLSRIYTQQREEIAVTAGDLEADINDVKDQEILQRGAIDKFIASGRILSEKKTIISAFESFLSILPSNIIIESLDVGQKDFRVQLSTSNLFSLETFLQDLSDKQKGGVFLGNIVTSSITQDITGIVQVNIEAKVKE